MSAVPAALRGRRTARPGGGLGSPRHLYRLISVISAVGFIGLWELAAVSGAIDPEFFPPPSHVTGELVAMVENGLLAKAVVASVHRVLVGFVLAMAVGVPLGIALGSSLVLRWVVDPILSIIRPMPSLAWIPLSLVWLGIGEPQKYAIVFMGTLAPLVLFTADATRRVDPLWIKAAQNLGASRLRIMVEVILPGALPAILSGLKVTLALAWTCIISAEMVGARAGLGFLIWNAKDWGNMSQVIIGMLAISATVLVMDGVFRLVEELLMPWRRHERHG